MTATERVRELVESLIDEAVLAEMSEKDWDFFEDYLKDCVHEVEGLAICIEEHMVDKLNAECEPQFDTLGEARGER